VLCIAATLPSAAQRPDGCGSSQSGSRTARDCGLEDAGYSLAHDSLIWALRDSRPDVRAAAAQRLSETEGKAVAAAIAEAWLAETDSTAKAQMSSALSMAGGALAWDAKQHPGGQRRVTHFQTCTPSEPPLISLAIEETKIYSATTVRISARNEMPQKAAYVGTGPPAQFFSVIVTGPTGEPVKVISGSEWMYQPEDKPSFEHLSMERRIFWPLAPHEEASWFWNVADDFDLSVPGTYRVSFGGRLDYLDTTACSNSLLLTVGESKQSHGLWQIEDQVGVFRLNT